MTTIPLEEIDLLEDTWAREVPHEAFERLRREDPVHWHPEPDGPGFWAVTKHADVKEVSKRNDVFGSSPDGAIPVWPQEMTRDAIDLQRNVLLNMDAPQHTRLRKIISRGFTPRAVGRLEEETGVATGLRRCGLGTDARTGARALYEHVGMRVSHTGWDYKKPL